ncbi:hypothetical protein V1286_002382 [Bradyrhizobium algeriense]|uniref:Uncharacterized protein n=1 Tax=Bradyrhizobium algeriense TaxID=634784 RepID=A0ABU8B8H9_9BRAD
MRSGTRSRAIKGWLAACGTAAAAIYALALFLFVIAAGARSMTVTTVDFIVSLILLPVILVFTCLLTAIPAALVVWISEVSRIRSALFFGFAGGAIGALSQAILFQSFFLPAAGFFALAGFVAGMTYWRIVVNPAGREPG